MRNRLLCLIPFFLLFLFCSAGCGSAGFYVAEISVHSSEWAEDVYLQIDQAMLSIYQNTGPTRPVGEIHLSRKQARAVKRVLESMPVSGAQQDFVPDDADSFLVADRSAMALSLHMSPNDNPILIEMTNCRLAEVGDLVQTLQDIIVDSAGPSSMLLTYLGVVWDPGFSGCKTRGGP